MYKIINIQEIKDSRGQMNVIEFSKILGFSPKRMFSIQNVPINGLRGDHAHKECIQVLHCLNGKVEVELDNGTEKNSLLLNDAGKILLIPANTWLRLRFLEESTILNVYASESYDDSDYIRNYEEFSKANLA